MLLAATLGRAEAREGLRQRRRGEWLLDLAGLAAQGVLVPLLQTALLYRLLVTALPFAQGRLVVPAAFGFLLNFVVVDYAYYWNHRLLHGGLWRWHAVHHTATRLDVFVTARNTLWTPLLIVYVWLNALGLFLLRDPLPFALSLSITAALDLWRHSGLLPRRGGSPWRLLSIVFITPADHAWHHSSERPLCNYGANLKVWDRLHGTLHDPGRSPHGLGLPMAAPPLQQWLLPSIAMTTPITTPMTTTTGTGR